jgi:hypothetical protein
MPGSTVRNAIKQSGGIKDKGRFVSAFCGLRPGAWHRSVTMTKTERILTVRIEDCNKKRIPLMQNSNSEETVQYTLLKYVFVNVSFP